MSTSERGLESDPLLPQTATRRSDPLSNNVSASSKREKPYIGFTLAFFAFLVIILYIILGRAYAWNTSSEGAKVFPADPLERARALLKDNPLIDGHIDLPAHIRWRYHNQLNDVDLNDANFTGHVNVPKLREGGVGGFIWSAFAACADWYHLDEGADFETATWRTRETLEQIDIASLAIAQYSSVFHPVTTSNGIRQAFKNGKIASLIGLEGAHQLGNSLGTLRQYYALGVRSMTLTHTCNNAFAGSCGFEGRPQHVYGLTKFGETLVHEMNRLGMIVDISHTSEQTARDVLKLSKAPVLFSHSNAKGVWNVTRNVPDDILESIGRREGASAIVMATFAPQFVSQHEDGSGIKATLERVADHIEHISQRAGRQNVGIGSDFDGIGSTPVGLEDVSKYPYLLAELIRRGWSDDEIVGLAGGNFLRTFSEVERVSENLRTDKPHYDIYAKRKDL